jgi:hypothetical protein
VRGNSIADIAEVMVDVAPAASPAAVTKPRLLPPEARRDDAKKGDW